MTSSPAPADKPPRRRRTSAASAPSRGLRAGYAMRGLQGKVIDALGRDIVGGTYAPGSLLPKEADLTAAYGVSRTSVREAMKVLSAKGLIEIRQKIGTRVRARDLWNVFDSDVLTWHHQQGLSESVMRDLIELRQIIEPAAARFASSRASMADLRRIEHALADMARHVTDPVGYAESDVEFHMAVFAASHNALLSRFGHLVADFLHLSFSMQQEAVSRSGVDFSKDAEEHRRVYDAINRGEPDAAAAAMLNVILDGKRALGEAMETLSR
ncbi:FadR/GntR family transcriptional regulator [Devosia sp.]|uniref:FadR/GntR family transcriptional regulator n=1 Tax=Devosia sp. TaxID=1871048 RepID=UPI001AC343F6|nr:FadR/GntR family transcriptional regulator [Devosia sp.]MBN9308087.1 FadR family transcriptional regulator [Devosia sp.]